MQKVKSQAQYSFTLPSWDANPQAASTLRLVGSLYSPGALAQIRYTDPVVAPVMDALRSHVGNLVWTSAPADESPESRAAKMIVDDILASIGWREHVEQVWDYTATFGFLFYEFSSWQDDRKPYGYGSRAILLHPSTISRITSDEPRLHIQTVEQQVDAARAVFQNFEILHYRRDDDVPGNFLGRSLLRPLLLPFTASEIDLKCYLDARQRAKGVYHAKPNDSTQRSPQEWDQVEDSLDTLVSSDTGWITTPEWIDLQVLAAANPPDAALGNWQYFDALKRSALGHFLENLGLSGSGSNRALGEVLSDADNERWQAQIVEIERIINAPHSLIHRICTDFEIPEHNRPLLEVVREESVPTLDETLDRLAKAEAVTDPEVRRILVDEIMRGRK